MSDSSPSDPTLHDPLSAYAAQRDAWTALTASARPANKAALFDVLEKAGLTAVIVTFDGGGDEGQIESVTAWIGATAVELPPGEVPLRVPDPDGTGPEARPYAVREVIERLAYDLLEATHAGWEINDGAFGTFTFDVAARAIALDHNERVMDTEHSEHVF